jgi:peptidyl-prolyl cis-trans isomerase C
VPEFGAALAKLKKGQTTDAPVKTQFGYHVIQLEDERDAKAPEPPPFDAVKAQLKQQMEQQQLAKYQQELREKAKVE